MWNSIYSKSKFNSLFRTLVLTCLEKWRQSFLDMEDGPPRELDPQDVNMEVHGNDGKRPENFSSDRNSVLRKNT